MDHRYLKYAERQAPRYTSYPSAPHFKASVNAAHMRQWLTELRGEAPISLYLHVPYCREICWYCGCNTHATRKDEPLVQFTDLLLKELSHIASVCSGRIVDIHWGGGTPNILSPEQFLRINTHTRSCFNLAPKVRHSIEIDPRHLDEGKVRAYAIAGVTRASLGVQDFNDHVQRAIGRVQSVEVVQRAVTLLRAGGIDALNMDLMFGLPGQSVADLRRSIDLAADMAPQRIALFGYAHVPWFKKRQRLIDEETLPTTLERFDQAEAAQEALEARGYVSIGIDHFALPSDPLAIAAQSGRLRRSFQGYVEEDAPAIIGVGPSAVSTLPQGYLQNASDPGVWAKAIEAGDFAAVRGHALSDDDRIRRRLIEQIMCEFVGDLRPLGGVASCKAEFDTLGPMFEDGMVLIADDQLVLHENAQRFCRVVGMAFDAYHRENSERHSRAI